MTTLSSSLEGVAVLPRGRSIVGRSVWVAVVVTVVST